MKIIYIFTVLLCFSELLSAGEDTADLAKFRLEQLKLLKTKQLQKWPKEAAHLYQGLHYKLSKAITTKEEFQAAMKLIPEKLKKGLYKPKKIKEVDGWFIVESGISIIALKKESDILMFGYQW